MSATNSGDGDRHSHVFDYTPFTNLRKGLREWWLSPPRSGIYRLIAPWEYRHLRFFGGVRVAVASIPAFAGFVCLAYGVPGWAAFFLVIAALNLAGGWWFLAVAQSASDQA